MQACFTTALSCTVAFAHRPKRAPVTSRRARFRVGPTAITPPNGAISTTSRRYKGVSWTTVEHMCKRIAQQARSQRFDVILAVTRGGLVPAVLLCEAFELRNILSATVMFYADNGEQFFGMTEPRFLAFPSVDALQGRRVLIVDDVWDSGRTAQAVRNRVKRANAKDVKVAVLHYKPDKNVFPGVQPDFYSAVTADWIVYPWERPSPHTPHVSVEADEAAAAQESADNSPKLT